MRKFLTEINGRKYSHNSLCDALSWARELCAEGPQQGRALVYALDAAQAQQIRPALPAPMAVLVRTARGVRLAE